MRRSGVPADEYIVARRALLDALEALQEHGDALVLVGAQAIYLHTGDAEIAVAEYTTDGDVLINPQVLQPEPEIAEAMRSGGFSLAELEGRPAVGIWAARYEINSVPATVSVDLLVPKSIGGGGRRAARIPPHEQGAVMKVHGLEAALVDNQYQVIGALEPGDERVFSMQVAGPASLLVSKCIKIGERVEAAASGPGRPDRVKPKDALDVFRILRACRAGELAESLSLLRHDALAGRVTEEAVSLLPELFGSARAVGSTLAGQAAYPEPPEEIAASCAALVTELMDSLKNREV